MAQIVESTRNIKKYQLQACLFDGHDYTTTDESPIQVSETLISYPVICIFCGEKNFVYSIIGDFDFHY